MDNIWILYGYLGLSLKINSIWGVGGAGFGWFVTITPTPPPYVGHKPVKIWMVFSPQCWKIIHSIHIIHILGGLAINPKIRPNDHDVDLLV